MIAASSSACSATRPAVSRGPVPRCRRRGRPAVAARTPAEAARRRTSRACRRPGRRRSSRPRCRRGSRRAERASRVLPGRPRPRWYWTAIFSATSTLTEPESAKNTCSRPGGVSVDELLRRASIAGWWVSPPNITCAIASSCRADRVVEHWVAVAVDRAPPRRHRVDQLVAVGRRRAARRSRARSTRRVGAGRHRRVRVPQVLAVERDELVVRRRSRRLESRRHRE